MKKSVKFVGLLLIVVLIVLQFFQPEKNQDSDIQKNDLMLVASVPDSLASLLLTACYDCHSNQTEYPWYNRISPVSWYLDKHIQKGKEELNLSEYGLLEKADKIGALSDIYDALEAGTMPLQSYMLIHRDARISQEEIETLINWTDQESLRLMRK